MATDCDKVPIIDISALVQYIGTNMENDEGVREVVTSIDKACRETGFFYVKGHGIPSSLLKEVRELSHQFFELPLEEKLKIKLSPATGYRGYQEVGDNFTKGVRDKQEAIDLYKEFEQGMYRSLGKQFEAPNLWPSQNVQTVMEEYVILCKELAKTIMRGISLALGGVTTSLEGNVAGDPFWMLRLNGYPPNLNDTRNHIGCGIHTDYGLLGLLNQDDNIRALQIQKRSEEWIWAPPIPDTFVCNIGDMIEILSNGIYKSTPHQVLNTSSDYRVSVGFFYEANFESSIQPLEFCIEKSGSVRKFGSTIYGNHLAQKVKNNFKF
ncbi:putative 2-oxoglutarate-dependent dioxygenase [Heracleum sosnowskyi]|uniref:2-oxoglutarate-dependent dioxygenase n=1 Tax=Heracleum sosnowskyi TaxID=360622 RepID=A0AAD8MDU0_9APIA|nr:putative 2-oxoglutarate-dependent dioxygenase [Heracleum sosnowskyi]